MNLTQLRAFHAVVRSGGVTRAAQQLGITQPAVSAQVKALEETFDVALLRRLGRSVEPTALGVRLAEIAQRLFAAEAEAADLLGSARDLAVGTLRVVADGPHDAMPLIARFKRAYPGIEVRVSTGNQRAAFDALVGEDADVAVLADSPDRAVTRDGRIYSVPCADHDLVLVLPADHPWETRRSVPLRDLSQLPLILREKGSMTRHLFETGMAAAGVSLEPVLEIESREALKEAVAAGLGAGIIASGELGGDSRVVAIPVDGLDEKLREYVVCLGSRRDLRLIRAFLGVVPPVPVPSG